MINQPIGIFDSGAGGLSVLKVLRKELPHEDFLYFGDTANLPYGEKAPEQIFAIVENILDFLLKKQVKAIIMACNTSSALVLPQKSWNFPIPLFGMIEPTVEALFKDYEVNRLGVIANPITVKSGIYPYLLAQNGRAFKVFAIPCPELVPLVERGEITSAYTRLILKEYLSPLLEKKIDGLILGCTHYPFLNPVIRELMGESGEQVKIVDPAYFAVARLSEELGKNGLLRNSGHIGRTEFLVSSQPDKFKQLAELLLKETFSRPGEVNPALAVCNS